MAAAMAARANVKKPVVAREEMHSGFIALDFLNLGQCIVDRLIVVVNADAGENEHEILYL